MDARQAMAHVAEITERIGREYEFLYDARDRVAGYREALAAGDAFIDSLATEQDRCELFHALVMARGDVFTSDREVAALAYVLGDYGII